jgi:hypothetical protein
MEKYLLYGIIIILILGFSGVLLTKKEKFEFIQLGMDSGLLDKQTGDIILSKRSMRKINYKEIGKGRKNNLPTYKNNKIYITK